MFPHFTVSARGDKKFENRACRGFLEFVSTKTNSAKISFVGRPTRLQLISNMANLVKTKNLQFLSKTP